MTSATDAEPTIAIGSRIAADEVWIRSEATVTFHVHSRQHSVSIVQRRHRRVAASTSGAVHHVTDDVTALVEQPQTGEVALPVGVCACVIARLVPGRYDYSEVSAGQSVDQTG